VLFARRYEILSHLGGGGFGTVFHALDINQGFEVALKVFKPGAPPAYAFREAQALTALGGPNVLRVHNADVYMDVPYIATELALCSTADRVVPQIGVRTDLAVLWTRHMLHGLTVCHAAGLLHRDVKPANVFLKADDLAQLGDFGLVEPFDAAGHARVAGTPRYMAPEAVLAGHLTVRSDVYGAGLTLWELLAGSQPFTGVAMVDLPSAVAGGVRARLRDEAPHVPAAAARVVERAVSLNPVDRYDDPAAMNSALGMLPAFDPLWERVFPTMGATWQWETVPTRLILSAFDKGATVEVETRQAGSGNRVRAMCKTFARRRWAVELRALLG